MFEHIIVTLLVIVIGGCLWGLLCLILPEMIFGIYHGNDRNWFECLVSIVCGIAVFIGIYFANVAVNERQEYRKNFKYNESVIVSKIYKPSRRIGDAYYSEKFIIRLCDADGNVLDVKVKGSEYEEMEVGQRWGSDPE